MTTPANARMLEAPQPAACGLTAARPKLVHAGYELRPIARRDGGASADRASFVRFIAEHREYLQSNDIWCMPTKVDDLPSWLDGLNRVVYCAMDASGRCVGFSGLDRRSVTDKCGGQTRSVCWLWYAVEPSAQGRGLATAMAKAAIEKGLHRFKGVWLLRLDCRLTNLASQGVAEALGMVRAAGRQYVQRLMPAAEEHTYIGYEGDVATALGRWDLVHMPEEISDTGGTGGLDLLFDSAPGDSDLVEVDGALTHSESDDWLVMHEPGLRADRLRW